MLRRRSSKPFLPLTAKAFRRRVLRPVEGVFLFHPRAMERLVHQDLDRGLLSRHVPPLSYYLIPRETFLVALEDENPDALSVIEGIDLPAWVILLPTPSASLRLSTPPDPLLYRYWARRFEAEVARAWQQARDAEAGHDSGDPSASQPPQRFDPQAFEALIGEAAVAEIRDVLERDRRMVLEQDDASVLRRFVGLVTRLRYFAPGQRALWFPAIRDWAVLDAWLATSGLELPAPDATQLPPLLSHSRPLNLAQKLQAPPELPPCLDYCQNDPDGRRQVQRTSAAETPADGDADAAQTHPLTALQRFCLQGMSRSRGPRAGNGLLRRLSSWAGRLLSPLLFGLRPPPPDAQTRPAPGPLQRRIRAEAFHHRLHAAKLAEKQRHRARAMRRVIEASWHYQHLATDWQGSEDPVLARLSTRLARLADDLVAGCPAAWGASDAQCATVGELLQRLASEQVSHGRIGAANRVVHRLEQAIDAAGTQFLQLRWWRWLRSRGREPLREPLPYQSHLKALRALDAALIELDRLPWPEQLLLRYRAPIAAARGTLAERLQQQLYEPIDAALSAAGMVPVSHRQRVALRKLRVELLEVVDQRYHLRYGDVRDAVARNDLRLDDLRPREYLLGDRLSRLDHALAARLPGFYRRGEVYLKGLHLLSTWLFGSDLGRRLTRYLLLPFGASLILLVVIDHVSALFAAGENPLQLANTWSVVVLGLVLNALFHTRFGQELMTRTWIGIRIIFTVVVLQGLRRLLDWGPVAQLLRNPAVRELSRYLVEPLAIGLLTLVPVFLVVMFALPERHTPPWQLFALGFVVGSFLRNTQLGRRLLDTIMARLMLFWSQVRDTLVSGVFRLVVDFFKGMLDAVEQFLYRIEEIARYRSGESVAMAATKSAVRPVGAAVSYVTRFYVTVLVEPQVNPIKHFPVVTVSHKMMLPALPALTTGMLAAMDPFLPRVISLPFVTATILLLPGFFGFLVWELKENWKLFSANRPPTAARPVLVGHHGETLRVMLRRGLHAGTVPKSFDRLRRRLVSCMPFQAGDTKPAIKLRKAGRRLINARDAIQHFRDRELRSSLHQQLNDGRLASISGVRAGRLYLASAALELTLILSLTEPPDGGRDEVELAIDYAVLEGELQATLAISGPIDGLPAADRQLLLDEVIAFLLRSAAGYRERQLRRQLQLET